MPALNPLDWILAALLLYSTLRAAMNGFFREAFSLAGLALGFTLACWYYRPLAHSLGGLLTTAPVAHLVSFFLILAAVTIGASLLGRAFRRGARTVGLGFLDRLGGACFGLLRGAGLAAALLVAITAFLPTAPWVQNSQIAPFLLRGSHAVSFAIPPELRNRLIDGLHRINHSSADWIKSGPLPHTGSNEPLLWKRDLT